MVNIALNFLLGNFFVKQNKFRNLWNKTFSVAEHKTIELEFILHTEMLVEFDFMWSSKIDHAGVTIVLGLFGHSLNFNLYDRRHWNEEENRWYRPGESMEEFEDDLP